MARDIFMAVALTECEIGQTVMVERLDEDEGDIDYQVRVAEFTDPVAGFSVGWIAAAITFIIGLVLGGILL